MWIYRLPWRPLSISNRTRELVRRYSTEGVGLTRDELEELNAECSILNVELSDLVAHHRRPWPQ